MVPLLSCSPHPVKPMRSTYAPESPRKDEPCQACSPIQTTGQERLRPESAIGGSSAASVVQLEKMEPKQVSWWLSRWGQRCPWGIHT